MRKSWIASLVIVAALGFGTSAMAQCCKGKADKTQASANTTKTTAAGKTCCSSSKTASDCKSTCSSAKTVAAGKTCCASSKTAADCKSTCSSAKTVAGGKSCDPAACAKKGCDPSQCSSAMACCSAPKMAYKVGSDMTCCSKTAHKMAKANGSEIKFVVAGKEYCNKPDAMTAYGEALESYLGNMTTVRYMAGGKCVSCPMEAEGLAKKSDGTVKYCVGSFQFDDEKRAALAAEAGKAAAHKVKMTMMVDGKSYCCSKSAKTACDKSGKSCTYVVGDNCKTECKVTAQVELAKARIDAARDAINKTAEVASAAQP